jgi:hypothetical protein
MSTASQLSRRYDALANAAQSRSPVGGLTHAYYRYPARFSPEFAGAAIELFSKEGDAVLDPFMGGGTTVVEALARGRIPYGSDLNELAVFVARTKSTLLTSGQLTRIADWLLDAAEGFDYRVQANHLPAPSDSQARNFSLPSTRPIKKFVRVILGALSQLPSVRERRFARCIVLRTGQWALDGRRLVPSLTAFRSRLLRNCEDMMLGMLDLEALVKCHASASRTPRLRCVRAECLTDIKPFLSGIRVPVVVTSPPYPGVHVLYHRWQVHGRKETPAPYWIAAARDGMGSAYYNFGDRRDPQQERYFRQYEASLRAIRGVMSSSGVLVQMVACHDPERQLPSLLEAIKRSGFRALGDGDTRSLIRRDVPGRKWHASMKGAIASSKEIVLVHAAQ